jgi:carboxypeptidase C (cathepsin A)
MSLKRVLEILLMSNLKRKIKNWMKNANVILFLKWISIKTFLKSIIKEFNETTIFFLSISREKINFHFQGKSMKFVIKLQQF